jgi:hypothetical protein
MLYVYRMYSPVIVKTTIITIILPRDDEWNSWLLASCDVMVFSVSLSLCFSSSPPPLTLRFFFFFHWHSVTFFSNPPLFFPSTTLEKNALCFFFVVETLMPLFLTSSKHKSAWIVGHFFYSIITQRSFRRISLWYSVGKKEI